MAYQMVRQKNKTHKDARFIHEDRSLKCEVNSRSMSCPEMRLAGVFSRRRRIRSLASSEIPDHLTDLHRAGKQDT